MKDLKVGDERWVIACKEKENGFDFFPLLIKIVKVGGKSNTGKDLANAAAFSFVYNNQQKEDFIGNGAEYFYEDKESCSSSLALSVMYARRRAMEGFYDNQASFSAFIMV